MKRERSKRVLVVGSGGREHALAWKIAQSPDRPEVLIAPGNAGTAAVGENLPVQADDLEGIVRLARERGVSLVVVGPEGPLVLGLVDRLQEAGIPAFGPSKAAAQLEGSKAFAKRFLARHGIPTAAYGEFDELDAAIRYVRAQPGPQVVKADGLAAGKGVFVCDDLAQAEAALRAVLREGAVGGAGGRVVIEERLPGVEVSALALCDGERVLPLSTARDHKRAFDGDQGPNTGGMGAFSPAPDVDPSLEREILERVLQPAVDGMRADGIPYRGLLYAGLMVHQGRPYVLEFNARFGDPETQPLLVRLRTDLVPLLEASAVGSLAGRSLEWDPRAATCVVMVADGYPGEYAKGAEIVGLEEAGRIPDVNVFHAGTALAGGKVVTAGGRVLGVTALGNDVAAAARRAYEAVDRIGWRGARARRDVGL